MSKIKHKIIRNRAKCKLCGDIVESFSVHDYRECSCGNASVDGGRDYLKRSGNPEDMEDMSEIEIARETSCSVGVATEVVNDDIPGALRAIADSVQNSIKSDSGVANDLNLFKDAKEESLDNLWAEYAVLMAQNASEMRADGVYDECVSWAALLRDINKLLRDSIDECVDKYGKRA